MLGQAQAAELAAYTEQLLAPYVKQIAEQAERIGRLEAELEQARAQGQERRRWWRWWG